MDYPRSIKANTTAEVNAGKRAAASTRMPTSWRFYHVLLLTSLFAAFSNAEADLPPISSEQTESAETTPAIETAPVTQPSVTPSALPEIEARNFAVKAIKRSTSGKTYLFNDLTDAKAQVGKLLLLRREPDPTTVPAMAFRVVKLYPEKNQFAAKRIRRYGTTRTLESGVSYTALEKLGDLEITPPTAQDQADLKELESGMAPEPAPTESPPAPLANESGLEAAPPPPVADPYDADLDSGTTALDRGDSEEEEEDSAQRFGASVEEVSMIDQNRQWLSAGLGYFRTIVGGEDRYFSAAGARYGLNLGRMVFLKRAQLQDSITVEGGAFLAKLILFPKEESGSYTVMPLIGTLRYNLHVGESFGIFFYGGVMQTLVLQLTNPVESTLEALQKPSPAVGAGFFFRVGPGWYTRVDLGLDSFTLGLAIRF